MRGRKAVVRTKAGDLELRAFTSGLRSAAAHHFARNRDRARAFEDGFSSGKNTAMPIIVALALSSVGGYALTVLLLGPL